MTTYNIDEACRLSGISIRSLRNYVHHYSEHLHIERGPYNSLIFSDESLSVLVKIKSLLRDGNNRHKICELLREEAIEPVITVTRDSVPTASNQSLLQIFQKVDATLNSLLEENKGLNERLKQMEMKIAQNQKALPAPESIPVPKDSNKKANALTIPLPHSLLSLKDGCVAIAKSISSLIFSPPATVRKRSL